MDTNNENNSIFFLVIFLLITIAGGVWFWFEYFNESSQINEISKSEDSIDSFLQNQSQDFSQEEKGQEEADEDVIDYNEVEKGDETIKDTMEQRKARFGLTDSLDMIVKSDEKIKIGDQTIDMEELETAIAIKEGDFVEKDIKSSHKPDHQGESRSNLRKLSIDQFNPSKKMDLTDIPNHEKKSEITDVRNQEDRNKKLKMERFNADENEIIEENINEKNPEKNQDNFNRSLNLSKTKFIANKDTYMGVRVVKPDENIWEIHFEVLKDYYGNMGIQLAPSADEPNFRGYSSGIGKILKFSEKIVNIYNVQTKKFQVDLNLIEPNSVIIVYNMNQIFELLNQIDYTNVNRIEFDGTSLWIPAMN